MQSQTLPAKNGTYFRCYIHGSLGRKETTESSMQKHAPSMICCRVFLRSFTSGEVLDWRPLNWWIPSELFKLLLFCFLFQLEDVIISVLHLFSPVHVQYFCSFLINEISAAVFIKKINPERGYLIYSVANFDAEQTMNTQSTWTRPENFPRDCRPDSREQN